MTNSNRNVTPAVRALAQRLGVDTSRMQGSGVGGRIRSADVWAAGGALSRSTVRAQASTGRHNATGETPPSATTSGLDPAVLAKYPAAIRAEMAAAPTAAEAIAIGDLYRNWTW